MKKTLENEIGSRSTRQPNGATQKLKDYFSSRIHGNSGPVEDQDDESLLQPGFSSKSVKRSRPRTEDFGLAALNDENEARRLRREQKLAEESRKRFQKQMQAGERRRSQPSNRASFQQINPPLAFDASSNAPPLRRKQKFSRESSTSDKMAVLQHNRDLIRSGHMEKVVPPPLQVSPAPNQGRSSYRKTESTAQKLNSYISASASLLDTTRRDISKSLRQSAERALSLTLPIYHPHTLDLEFRQSIIGDQDNSSEESFYCIGENKNKSLDELDQARRLSGCGTSPWVDGMQEMCRLCGKGSPSGIRGLCQRCERLLKQMRESRLSDGEETDEIKPTPPLKIRKANTTWYAVAQPKDCIDWDLDPFADENEIENPPLPPPKNSPVPAAQPLSPRFSNTETSERSPRFVGVSKRVSMQAEVDGESSESERDYGSRFERWQSKELRAEYERGEREFVRWSASLLKSPTESLAPVPQSTENRMEGGIDELGTSLKHGTCNLVTKLRRNSSFYEFWEEVLKTPRAAE